MNVSGIRIFFLSLLAAFVWASCEETPTQQGSTSQLGTFQGRVIAGASTSTAPARQAASTTATSTAGAGLDGVRVVLYVNGEFKVSVTSTDNAKTKEIDEAGYFTLKDLPSGVPLIVTFEKSGFTTLKGKVTIPATSAGEGGGVPLKDPIASVEVSMSTGTGSQEIDFNRLLLRGTVQGVVKDGTPGSNFDKPLSGVTITLFLGGDLVTASSKSDDSGTKTFDETGFFSVPNLPPGQPMIITLEKSGYKKARGTVTISVAEGSSNPAVTIQVYLYQGDSSTTVDVDLKPRLLNGTLQGVVRDGTIGSAFGTPLAEVTVSLFVEGGVTSTTTKSDDSGTSGFDESGLFSVSNLPPGESIIVTFEKSGYARGRATVTIPGDATPSASIQAYLVQSDSTEVVDIDVTKPPKTSFIQGVVIDGSSGTDFGKGLADASVTAVVRGKAVTKASKSDDSATSGYDETGYFLLPNLPPGETVLLSFEKSGYVTVRGSYTVPAEGQSSTSNVRVVLTKGSSSQVVVVDLGSPSHTGSIQGVVRDGSVGDRYGKPLSGVTVSAVVAGQLFSGSTQSDDPSTAGFDETGQFTLSGLPSGAPILVTFSKSGYSKTQTSVTIPTGTETSAAVATVNVSLISGSEGQTFITDVSTLPYNGTIQGIVRDGTVGADFGKPLSGVGVAALVQGRVISTTTKSDDQLTPGFNETGFFAINNLPIDVAIPVRFSLDGYVSLTSVTTIVDPELSTSVEQETAQITVDVDLVKAAASLKVIVYANAGPANGASVVVDLTSLNTGVCAVTVSNSTGTCFGAGYEVRKVGTTDATGTVTFTELPPVVLPVGTVIVQPFKEGTATEEGYETEVFSESIDLRQLSDGTGVFSGPNTIRFDLRAAGTTAIAPATVWTNADDGYLNKTVVIECIYNTPMQTTEGTYVITLTTGGNNVPFTPTWTDGIKLRVDPVEDLQPGNSYVFNVATSRSASGLSPGAACSGTFTAITGASALASPQVSLWQGTASAAPKSNADVDYDTTVFNISWPADPSAFSYRVYLKDGKLDQDWQRETVISQPTIFIGPYASILAAVTIPARYDAVAGGGTEPFAFGNSIDFAVTAVNLDGVESAFDTTKKLRVNDGTPPNRLNVGGAANAWAPSALTSGEFTFGQLIVPNQTNVTTGNSANNACAGSGCSSAKKIWVFLRTTANVEPLNNLWSDVRVLDATNLAGSNSTCFAGTQANTVLPTITTSTWTVKDVNNDAVDEYQVEISVPAGGNAVGDCIRFNLDGVQDSSGNREDALSPAGSAADPLPNPGDGAGLCSGDVCIYKLN